ncbi:MAG TPA: 1-deoxy-D-xylulose-5-phosphate reductoisomerase [Sulfuricurvum sp.]|nr:MAG: 1-deoxy-D-xylulose-5-phosphate reductoisomerase [Campylobacterales bacterium 16-40-21]OZA03117.1 MAG: 1-deoxy-D-xylulose-5-phosphate reductoisomerase [Sulfuricurvum sp. 17-40-25]HQS67078.1 1-deoxy-D-xylulose-5-phosphate reductoisomerase [Sulfuricurvum sp.]HQT36734.1 1-deoxy-D-xylulose-5-phosphate reductoisomerase [Sulfuricurvum sp.]
MILLGSTGSIGVNALAIAQQFGLAVDVLVAGRNIALLNQQIQVHKPSVVVVADGVDLSSVQHPRVMQGEAAILEVIASSSSELVINALVGFAGLQPTLKAIECGKRVALANKESLVAAGAFMDISKIQPIDSEHFGLWYLHNSSRPIERMLITASGGAFRDWPIEKIQEATLKDALNHPNWSMGQKITIDSASMMNKMFELLEARWLFGEGEYDAIIETKSIIHALIDYRDGSTTAHIARADMQLPIAYALMGEMDQKILSSVNLLEVGSLEFREITTQRYPIWEIRKELLRNPKRGVIINAANEAAIELFVEGKISFLDISKQVIHAFEHFTQEPKSIEEVFAMDLDVRNHIKSRA